MAAGLIQGKGLEMSVLGCGGVGPGSRTTVPDVAPRPISGFRPRENGKLPGKMKIEMKSNNIK